MGYRGFFTREDVRKPAKRPSAKPRGTGASKELLHKLGLRGVDAMNPQAHNPMMEPIGSDAPLVYVLGSMPGAACDEAGAPFQGQSHQRLRKLIPGAYRQDVRYNNTVRTRPPDQRKPTEMEIECFRPSVVEDIEKTKPVAILLVGGAAISWAMPGISKARLVRGRRFPVRVGKHACWAFPIVDPAFVMRAEQERRGLDDAPGEQWAAALKRDVQACFRLAENLPKAAPRDPKASLAKIQCLAPKGNERLDVEIVLDALKAAGKARACSFDLETRGFHYYSSNSAILTFSVAWKDQCLAFPIKHPGYQWSTEEFARIEKGLKAFFLRARSKKIAFNCKFEMEWMVDWLGDELFYIPAWEDPMLGAYCLDSRKGGHSLDFGCFEYFGFFLKPLSKVDVANLANEELGDVLLYNGLDSYWTLRLAVAQRKRLKESGLLELYYDHVDRVPALIGMQRKGFLVDQDSNAELADTYEEGLRQVDVDIQATKAVQKYCRSHGPFSPSSDKNVAVLFRDVLGRKEGVRGDKYSTDVNALEAMGNLLIAKLILKRRALFKLRGTYVIRFRHGAKNSLIYPDGRIHPQFHQIRAVSGRLASSGPNGQNWPKRKHPEIRKQLVADPGQIILSFDYGQIEGRVMAAIAEDEFFCKALFQGYDVHMHFAELIASVYPKALREQNNNIGKLRGELKNTFVFPLFYGANPGYVCRMVGLPERIGKKIIEEFWETFKGIAAWQKRTLSLYEKRFYVEAPDGRRRYGPLSENHILNHPPQGGASDIVMEAAVALHEISIETDRPWLAPASNVHDDLTFIVPRKKADDASQIIIEEMCGVTKSWYTVPHQIEASRGSNLYQMTDVGKFESHKLQLS